MNYFASLRAIGEVIQNNSLENISNEAKYLFPCFIIKYMYGYGCGYCKK